MIQNKITFLSKFRKMILFFRCIYDQYQYDSSSNNTEKVKIDDITTANNEERNN